jgi:hypothetical protein
MNSRCTFLNLKCPFYINYHTFLTRFKPESNLQDSMLFAGGKPRGECPGGDIEWLNTWVIILGDNSGLLSPVV